MNGLRLVFLFGTVLLGIAMLSGCAGLQAAPQAANQTSTTGQNASAAVQQPAANQTAPVQPIASWKQYRQATFSFDYPAGLETQESLGSYMEGRGYAVVILQNENIDDPTMIAYYVRYGNISTNLSAPLIAKAFLESDNKGEDMLGVLHQAASKGSISEYGTARGYGVADMTFKFADPKSGKELNGYAIQVYDPATTVGMKARILAADAQKALETRDRFVESLKIGNST